MPQVFDYKARSLGGQLIKGRITADSQLFAVNELRGNNLFVVEIKQIFRPEFKLESFFSDRISLRSLAIFCRQLSIMIDAGISIVESLRVLLKQTENKALQKLLGQVITDVEKGRGLSEAFNCHRVCLPHIFVNMLAIGEVSGNLGQIFNRLSDHLEKEIALKDKVRSAMIYPLLVGLFAFLAMLGLMIFLVPVFVDIFSQSGIELPLPTKIVLAVSDYWVKYWHLTILLVIITVMAFKRIIATTKGRVIYEYVLLKTPLAGDLMLKLTTARFARTLSTLLRSGVPLVNSLEITRKMSGNAIAAREIALARERIIEGDMMSPVFVKSKLFPPLAVSMIAIGEESGALDLLLEKLAIFYERQAELTVSRLSSIIEPVMIAGVGLFVAVIALSIYLPIFKISSVIQANGGM